VTRAGAGVSTRRDPVAALDEVLAAALGSLGSGAKVDAALLFATPAHASALEALLARARAGLGSDRLAGALAYGVIGCGREADDPGLALLAFSGIDAQPFLLRDLAGHEDTVGGEIHDRLGGSPRAEDLVVVLPDPGSFDVQALVEHLVPACGDAIVVGAGSADPALGRSLQWAGTRLAGGALAGIVLRGARRPRVAVTQACRPRTPLMTVTRAQGHWLLELDGRPALDVYREVARGPLAEDLRRAASFVLVAIPRSAEAPLAPGNYLVRNVAGFATDRRALAVPEQLRAGDQVALALREPESAREDLRAMLEPIAAELATAPDPGAGAALYFDCVARGRSLFGVEGIEVGYLESALRGVPLLGMLGSCEIGPVGRGTELLTYTGVLALLGG
jgi:small ligand-binding sensory domain FIST